MAYYFYGVVNESTIPVDRVVRAHRADTGEVVGETTSHSGTGVFSMETTYSGLHYIVCLDDYTDQTYYNDLIYGNIYPTTYSG